MKSILVTLLIISLNIQAQKLMKMDSSLKANSIAAEVKLKSGISIGAIEKYRFANYQVIKTSQSWGKEAGKSELFGKIEKSTYSHKASFVMLHNDKDSIQVNIVADSKSEAISGRFLTFGSEGFAIEKQETARTRTTSIVATIHTSDTITDWDLLFVVRRNTDSSFYTKKYAVLTNGVTTIEAREVKAWENNKEREFYLTKGFEFWLNGQAIAAVQFTIDTFQKKWVWLRNDLDDSLKKNLAAAIVVLLGYGHSSE